MMLSRTIAFSAAFLLAAAPVAKPQEHKTAKVVSPPERTFAVVERSSLRTYQGSWQQDAPLLRYVHNHPGTYVVFAQGGELYRLDRPEQMAEVERLYAPLQELSVRQEALAQAQKPLAQRQQALGAQQRAEADPLQKGRIGQAQGALGQEQGDLGALQGELGRRQGGVARAAY